MIKTRVMRRAEDAASTGEKRISYRVLVGKSEGVMHTKNGKNAWKNQA
jgi:hypothetical protein